MEHDAEIKNDDYLSYTTEFRQYDPRVGRWMSVDPIVKDWESPFAGFANNPIFYVDPSGLDPSSGGDDPQVRHSNNTNNGQAKAPDGSSAVPLGATKLMYYTSGVRTLNGWDYAVEPGSVGAYEYNGATYGALYKDGVFIGYTLTADSPPPVSPAIAPRVAQATADVGVSINTTPLFEEAAPEQRPEDIPTHWILPSQEQLGCDYGDPTTGFSSNFGRTVNAYSDGLNGFATFIEWNVVAMTVFMGGGEAALARSIVGGTVNRGIPRVVTKVVTEVVEDGIKQSAPKVNRIYSARELIRRSAEPGPFHNFPESLNSTIFAEGTKTVTPNFFRVAKPNLSNTSIMYKMPGVVNGRSGVFEIATRPSVSGNTEMIMHRFFRPH